MGKKYIYLGICLFIGAFCPLSASQLDEKIAIATDMAAPKQRIVVLSSLAGGGHTSAAQAMVEQFAPDFRVDVVNLSHEIDNAFIRVTGGSDYWYNTLLQRNWTGAINVLAKLSQRWFTSPAYKKQVTTFLDDLIRSGKPAIIISVMPLIAEALFSIAEKHHIPALLIILDFDPHQFVYNLTKVPNNCTICVPDRGMLQVFKEKYPHLYTRSQAVQCVDLPVRKQFLLATPQCKLTPKQPLKLLIMYGAQGGTKLLSIAQVCAHLSQYYPLTIIVCAGKNAALKETLEALTSQFKGQYHVYGFIPEIAALMKKVDVMVTKPGGMSLMEAMSTKTPLILDVQGTPLTWEKTNAKFASDQSIGWKFQNIDALSDIVQDLVLHRWKFKKARATIHALQRAKKTNVKRLIGQAIFE